MRFLSLLFFFAAAWAQTLDKPALFLVKLSDPIGIPVSKPGAPVGAVIISPETFLGGRFEGSIKQAAGGKLQVVFHALKHKDKTRTVSSVTTDFVNSKGHPSVDDEERPLRLESGVLVTTAASLLLDEGAELKLTVTPRSP